MDTKMEKFRSLQEVKKYLNEIAKQMRLDDQRVDQSVLNLGKLIKAAEKVIRIGEPGEHDDGKKVKVINIDFPMVQVPSKAALEKNYKLAEELSERYKDLQQNENQVRLTFRDSKGPLFAELMASFRKLRTAMEQKLRTLFAQLNKVAEGHAPKEFKSFMEGVAEEIEEHLQYDDAKTAMYASVDKEGSLVFAAYIILTNAISDEHKVAPHLYIVLKWTVGGSTEIFLEHEFVAPSLLEAGVEVANLHQAAKAIKYQLSLEGFSAQIGTLPISMFIRTPRTGLIRDIFKSKDLIKSVKAEKDTLIFVLKPGITTEQMQKLQGDLYFEVRTLVKAKRETRISVQHSGNELRFSFSGLELQNGVMPHDIEFLKDKYGLSEEQIRKLANVINSGK